MPLTRRLFTIAGLAALGAPGIARPEARPALVIALNGRRGQLPAPTREDLQRAIAAGADFLETPLVPTQDEALVALTSDELSGFTDVSSRSEFANRKSSRTINGVSVTGWFVQDFTLAELRSLALEAPGTHRPGSPSSILSIEDVIDEARKGSVRTARVIGIYAGLADPQRYANGGLSVEPRLADVIRLAGYDSPAAAKYVYAREPDALRQMHRLCQVRLALRLAPSSQVAPTGAAAETDPDFADIRSYAQAVAPDAGILVGAHGPDLIGKMKSVGLAIHAWAPVESRSLRQEAKVLNAIFASGVDGIATDAPKLALKSRRSDLAARGR
ncbi:MAG: glycerophosphodiester phosphodiesterase family protein [Caulobacteraceae bacterium]